jgi:hypothetical protein
MQTNFDVWVAVPSFSSLCHREEVVAWLDDNVGFVSFRQGEGAQLMRRMLMFMILAR